LYSLVAIASESALLQNVQTVELADCDHVPLTPLVPQGHATDLVGKYATSF
jgi:hypothetical protein